MNKGYVTLVICCIALVLQALSANETPNTGTVLYDRAEAFLAKGDTVKACALFNKLRVEADSIARQNYQNEVKAIRTTYQIDELYLENKLQESVILKRFIYCLLIIVLLLASAFGYLYHRNRKLDQARMIAQRLKEEAEQSIQSKTELLYTISKDMTKSLTEMREITATLQTTDLTSSEEVHKQLSDLRSSAEKLQDTYNRIFP